jgi:uncharacterized protein
MQVGATMDLLTPLVADVTADGLSLVGEVAADVLGLTEEDAVPRGPFEVSLELMKADEMIAVTGVLEGTIVRQCVRCLKEFEDPLAFSVRAAFVSEAKAKEKTRTPKRTDAKNAQVAENDEESEGEADDRYHYQSDHLDLAPMLREHVILSAPMQPLCTGDCQGLCARCGKDLNEGPCQCVVEPPPSAIRVVRRTKQTPGEPAAS